MRKIFRINDIIDLPVVDSTSARRICTIRDVIIDLRENRVYALVCKERFFRRYMEAIAFRNVSVITQNSVAVKGITDRLNVRELNMKRRRFQSFNLILGKLVLGTHGEILGVIRDLLIDIDTGVIRAYELSEGYLDDFLKGRQIVSLEYGHKLTGKNIVQSDYIIQSSTVKQ
ncbi:MAG: PRC-barrel domain-containing protein [Pseudomonadota bacterium]